VGRSAGKQEPRASPMLELADSDLGAACSSQMRTTLRLGEGGKNTI